MSIYRDHFTREPSLKPMSGHQPNSRYYLDNFGGNDVVSIRDLENNPVITVSRNSLTKEVSVSLSPGYKFNIITVR